MTKRKTNEEFVKEAKTIHKDKYNYSKVEYKNYNTKVCIVCPEHGEFWQTPSHHLNGSGCPKCGYIKVSKQKTKTTENFINEAKTVFGDRYDYSKTEYRSVFEKVCIICSKHGDFWQTPNSHLQGCGCIKCANEAKSLNSRCSLTDFIEKANETHTDKYDYTNVEYINSNTKVCIICPKHGEFWQQPYVHLLWHGCPKCGKEPQKEQITAIFNEFVKKANSIHSRKYSYIRAKYINSKTKMCIICPEHGEFWQTPNDHLSGKGCPLCANHITYNNEIFIEKSKEKHGEKYDYSKVKYIQSNKKVCIICPKHGEFWQQPYIHLLGHGCPKCKRSHMEEEIALFLDKNNIKYIEQYTIDNIVHHTNKQTFDFYLPQYNVAIECQGKQHFKESNFGSKKFTASQLYSQIIHRDAKKLLACKQNNINIMYYTNLMQYDYFLGEKVYHDKEIMLNDILKNNIKIV